MQRRVAPNVLAQVFRASAPNRIWVGDITYVWTAEGWSYLAVLLDLFSSRVVGWAVADHMRRELLLEHRAACSMSRAGDRYDNAVAESFFASLKKECVHHRRFATRTEAFDAIAPYIDGCHNPVRRHSAIEYLSPINYELAERTALAA